MMLTLELRMFPLVSVAMAVIMWVPVDNTRLIVPPVPIWPSRLENQMMRLETSPSSGSRAIAEKTTSVPAANDAWSTGVWMLTTGEDVDAVTVDGAPDRVMAAVPSVEEDVASARAEEVRDGVASVPVADVVSSRRRTIADVPVYERGSNAGSTAERITAAVPVYVRLASGVAPPVVVVSSRVRAALPV